MIYYKYYLFLISNTYGHKCVIVPTKDGCDKSNLIKIIRVNYFYYRFGPLLTDTGSKL